MDSPSTLTGLLQTGAGDAVALRAPGGAPPLAHGALRELARRTVARLNALGVGRGDRVALVLPNGPAMAAAFTCVAVGASTAPLNPGYTADELGFYLSDLRARALVLEAGADVPARHVAARLGLPVLELVARPAEGAGAFELMGPALAPRDPARRAPAGGPGSAGDEALVLHTSGTTARPKLVPLLQRNLVASARSVAASLALGPHDLCLNVMPLFHIHGLVAALLASLGAGASVACTPGFNALRFFGWLEELRPTWYTAVPTMHQAILARAPRHAAAARAAGLRLIRSSSASLPPPVMAELEATFAAPVIEAYGMTEAAHQMACNPLPPRPRKPGSVGVAAGPELAIMDDAGALLPAGAVGEVVVRGPSITPGYDGDPAASARAFTSGWFRTGDQGALDPEGYLRLTGRLKELINRGGEKISPLEVDAVLLGHPAVAQAVTFGAPHPKLGEEVMAAVVLREGARASERELRAFAAGQLADFKVPRAVLLVPEIPKGPTGKVQRLGLAARLGIAP